MGDDSREILVYGWRIVRSPFFQPLWITGLLLTISAIKVASAPPDSVDFIFSSDGADGYWPGESIVVEARWSASAESLNCRVLNHDNNDAVTILLIPDTEDTNSASASVPFLTGWELAADSEDDERLQCTYGDRISAEASGAADSCRILVEEASIGFSSEGGIFVGSVITLTWADRDANKDYAQKDSVLINLQGVNTGHEQGAVLRETTAQSGIFQGMVTVECVLAEETDSLSIHVLDTDNIIMAGVDSLYSLGEWGESNESTTVDTILAISTRTALIEARHSEYGELDLFPISGDSLIFTIHEHDLEGIGSLRADVSVYRPDGILYDSLAVTAFEDSRGQFSTSFTIDENDADISAQTGDSLVISYQDRADSLGVPLLVNRTMALGANIIQGDISESIWDSEIPYLLVDSTFVVSGNSLQVNAGVHIQVVPGKNIALVVDGDLNMGNEATMDSVHIGASSAREAGNQWEGLVVRGTSNLVRTIVSDARIGISVEENGTLIVRNCLFEHNGEVSEDQFFDRETEYDETYANSLRNRSRGWPGGISARDADITISHVTIRLSEGYGISILEGICAVDSSCIYESTEDAMLLVQTVGDISNSSLQNNNGSAIYGYGSNITISDCYLVGNTLEGLYSVGGSVITDGTEFSRNLNGGILIRDECMCSLNSVFITRNHHMGVDAAWDCRLDIENSAIVGNGGNGLAFDYETILSAHNSSIAYNRNYGIHVGSWSLDDTLDATQCWWGEFPPAADSTGTNLDAIWDGHDANGRSEVLVFPVLEAPAPYPAPMEETNVQGGVLRLSFGSAAAGDTVFVRFTPEDSESHSEFTVAMVMSPLDSLASVLQWDGNAGLYEAAIVISNEVNSDASDQIAAAFGDRISAYMRADSTIANELLPAESGFGKIECLSMDVFPNPFRDRLNIQWTSHANPVLTVYDLHGRETIKKHLIGTAGTIRIDSRQIRYLPPGVYVLRLTGDSHALSRRIVHIR